MGFLSELRADLADSLDDLGIKASSFVPERITPPVVIITAGDPYVEQATYCEFTVRLNLEVITATASNSIATDALDDVVESIVIGLGDYDIETVSSPWELVAGTASYLGATVTVTREITLAA